MKIHHILTAIAIVMLATTSPSWASNGGEGIATENREAHATALQNRLEEIRGIDKTKLAAKEKRALRREVRAIKKELAAISGGVYLSVGAILLIALLLILLL